MIRILPLLLLGIMLSACGSSTATGPTMEDGTVPIKEGSELEFELSPDIDYRAQGPFSEGPDAPPNAVE